MWPVERLVTRNRARPHRAAFVDNFPVPAVKISRLSGLNMLRRLLTSTNPPYVWLRQRVTNLLFERKLGIRISGEISLEGLGIAAGVASVISRSGG